MATKYFCDYCGAQLSEPGKTVFFKMIIFAENDLCTVYRELCSCCISHFKDSFKEFIDGLGDNVHDI